MDLKFPLTFLATYLFIESSNEWVAIEADSLEDAMSRYDEEFLAWKKRTWPEEAHLYEDE